MFFGHLTEVLGLLVLGLIIFGPKRMIELGGQLGRMLREARAAMKEMNWNLLGDDAPSSQTPLSKLSQFAQDIGGQRSADAVPAAPPHVVEMTSHPTSDAPTE